MKGPSDTFLYFVGVASFVTAGSVLIQSLWLDRKEVSLPVTSGSITVPHLLSGGENPVAEAHYNLGNAVNAEGQLNAAIAEYREAA